MCPGKAERTGSICVGGTFLRVRFSSGSTHVVIDT